MARRAIGQIGQVFTYAMRLGIVTYNPTYKLSQALTPRQQKNFARITINQLPQLLSDIDSYKGDLLTKLGFYLLAYTFVRTNELRFMQWNEVDWQAKLAHEILTLINSHIACNEAVAITATIWIFFSWCIDVSYNAPIAWINAPMPRCGKSTLAKLMGRMTKRTISTSNITPAALFRSIEKYNPTLIIDEADTFLNNSEDLRGIINAGFDRDDFLMRCVGDNHESTPFNVFGAKVISGIGKLTPTVMDRSISLTLKRKLPSEKKQRLKELPKATTIAIQQKLARWADDNMQRVAESKPQLPESIYNRDFDKWEILFQIADSLGGNWLKLVTNACMVISQSEAIETHHSEELLSDIKTVFERQGVNAIPTRDLLNALTGADSDGLTLAWATSNKGQPMTDRQLAKMLKEFEIKSKQIRFGEKNLMGYSLADFTDTFKRYLEK